MSDEDDTEVLKENKALKLKLRRRDNKIKDLTAIKKNANPFRDKNKALFQRCTIVEDEHRRLQIIARERLIEIDKKTKYITDLEIKLNDQIIKNGELR